MKKVLLLSSIMFIVLISFAACGRKGTDTPRASLPAQPEAVVTDAPKIISEDDNYIFSRELIDYSMCSNASYEKGIIDIPPVADQMPSITYVDDELNLYTFAVSTNEGVFCELGKYSIQEKAYTAMIRLDGGNAYGVILGVSNDYVVWKEVITTDKNLITKLHLYDQSATKDVVFYTDATNPETGSVYVINDNPVVILEKMVFFDEVTGYGVDGAIEMDVLCYNALTEQIAVISKMAKRPSQYLNGIIYLKKGEGNNSQLYAYIDGKESLVMDIDEDTADYAVSGNSICRSMFNYEDQTQNKKSVISTSLFIGTEAVPIVEGKQSNYTFGASSNEMAMVWEVINPEKPVYYDISNDRFVRLGSEETGYYASFVGKRFVLFLTQSDPDDSQSPLQYILIRN